MEMKLLNRKGKLLFVMCAFVCLYGKTCKAETANCDLTDKDGLPSDACTFDLRMKGAHPHEPDGYFCSGYDVEDILGVQDRQSADGYIVRYEALASADTAHHVLVFGCKNLRRNTGPVWRCGQVCDGEDQIIFAWAKNAPALSLPKDVGQHIGRTTDIKHIVVQIHYANALNASDNSGIRLYTTRQRQPYISGIYLLLGFGITIPRNTPKFHVDSSCRFDWSDGIVPFGFRTHAHSLCRVISGYKVENGEYKLIGKGNPQWPQAFYPVEDKIRINPGDILAARCTYNSTGRNRPTEIGSTANDEMCNFYIMYYMNSSMENSGRRRDSTCFENEQSHVFRNIPAGSDVPLPPNPALEGTAMGHHHHHGMGGSNHEDIDPIKVDEPQIANERPQVDFHGNAQNPENAGKGILRNNFGSQGKLTTSFGDSLLDDVYRNNGQGYGNKGSGYPGLDVRRPPSYMMDYPGLDDYYNEVIQQRSRNRLKKPVYDIYDSPDYDVGFAEFPKKSYPTLSRNRNKIFNDKYDEYAEHANSNLPNSEAKSLASKSESHSRHGIAMDTKKENQSDEGLHKSSPEMKLNKDLDLQFISEVGGLKIGQVGGLAVNRAGDLYIFHRGSNRWSSLSFTPMNIYTQQNQPVTDDPLIILDKDGTLKNHFGKNSYYLPHGLSLDSEENIWLTDVAMHQVFRIPKGGNTPDLELGKRFQPGTSSDHFCKPSDVAVMSTGEFFVSDGYCNSRIMKFDKNGNFLKQWGRQSSSWGSDGFPQPGTFNLPHGVALAEEKGLICVADRENGRIQCFDLEGNFVRQMHPKKFGQSLYSLEYCQNHGGVLFAVNGPEFGTKSQVTQGFTLDIDTGAVVSMWNLPGKGMTHPHDVAVDSTNHMVYVGELNPKKVWKFQMSKKMFEADTAGDVTKPSEGQGKSPTITGTSKHVSTETKTVEEKDGFAPSIIIGTLLVVPVILLVLITVVVRFHNTGRFKNCLRRSGKKSVFSLGNFLHSHKGFDRLSTEDDDHDYDNVLDDDSDNEEFNIVRKA